MPRFELPDDVSLARPSDELAEEAHRLHGFLPLQSGQRNGRMAFWRGHAWFKPLPPPKPKGWLRRIIEWVW